MRRNGTRARRLRIALAVLSLLTGAALAVGSNLAVGAEVAVSATVNRHCSVSVDDGFAVVRSNVPWEVMVTTASGTGRAISGGATNGCRIELAPGSRVEMVTQ